MAEARPLGAGLPSEGLEYGVTVVPAFAGQAQGTQGQVAGREPREVPRQGGRIEQGDLGALGGLQPVIGPQGRGPGRRPGQIEIAGLDEADVGALVTDGEPLADLAKEVDAEARDPTLTAVENCWRIELADSADEAWR